jgi:hypothetical protein
METSIPSADVLAAADAMMRDIRETVRDGYHLGPRGQRLGRGRAGPTPRGVACKVCGTDDWGGVEMRDCLECNRQYTHARREGERRPRRTRLSVYVDDRTGDEVRAGVPFRGGRQNAVARKRLLADVKRDAYRYEFGDAAALAASQSEVSAWYRWNGR